MSSNQPRDFTRRRMLASGFATFGAALILPNLSFAGPDAAATYAIAFDGGAVVVATHGALSRISSKGEVERLPQTLLVTALAAHPTRPDGIFAALKDGGLLRSLDGGRKWTDAGIGLPAAKITALTIAALEPDMIYAALAGDGLWRSVDAGETWEFVMDRPYLDGAEHDVLSLASVGNPSGMGGIWLYAGTQAGLTRVPDCFCRWQDIMVDNAMDALAAGKPPSPTAPLPEGEPVAILASALDAPTHLYAGLERGLWASTDAGVNWARVSEGPINALAVNPADPLHLVAVRAGGLAVSRDGGVTWTIFTSFKET